MKTKPMTTGGRRSWRRFGLAAVGLAAFLLLAATAQAGPPNHPALPGDPINGFALNKACGAATDSSGNVYVASAGNDAVEVFSPAGGHLATIANANEPCGLAVDSDGDLYVSETDVLATGTSRVVRYTPTAYPLTASPSWSAPVPIDSSAGAEGIAVDRTDDRLYVAKGDHVAVYDDDGSSAAQNEVQGVLVDATGGTYTLSFEGQTTAPLPHNAPSVDPGTPGVIDSVQEALEALPTIGSGNVSVTPGPAAASFAGDHLVTFVGALANTAVPQLTGDESALSGGFGLSITTQTQGFSGRIGEGDLTDATGVAAYTYGGGDRYVSVADDAGDEIRIFSGAALHSLALTRTVDGSGTPDGRFGFGPAGAHLAADPSNGHFFVYDHAHSVVDEFEATGEFFSRLDHPDFADAGPTGIAAYPQRDEVQRLTIGESRASGGSFTLAFEDDATGPLPYDAPAAQVQAALEGLAAIGAGNVVVTGGPLGAFGLLPYRIQFTGALGRRNVSPLVVDGSALTPAGSTATVTTLFEGSGPGRVYVTAGSGAGARLRAFGPLAPAGRAPLADLSKPVEAVCGAAADSEGNVYVSTDTAVRVFSPAGAALATIPVGRNPCHLAVDATGNLYVMRLGAGGSLSSNDDDVVRYSPNAYPFAGSPTYGPPTTVADSADDALFPGITQRHFRGIAVNPANGHLFLAEANRIVEFSSASGGSTVLNPDFAPSLSGIKDLDVFGATGEVYVAATDSGGLTTPVFRFNAAGTERLGTIDGSDSPDGGSRLVVVGLAVDQANGHVVVSRIEQNGFVEEYEASGAFVSRTGPFPQLAFLHDIAIDRSAGPNRGNLYVAYIDDLSAFGPLSYGEPPRVVTGLATAVAGGAATLNGSVDPTGFATTDCHFEYTTEADFEANGFASATSVPCAESAAEIGSGTGPVAVHADVTGLDPGGRYRFRLVATNEFGTGAGDARPFGPPVVTPRRATGVHYTEAVLNARLDPSGLATTYRFEYGSQGPCDAQPCASTPEKTLAADAPATDVKAPLVELEQGTTYHFRLVAENAAGSDAGPDGSFTTLARPVEQSCPNAALRTGPSAKLPDCRAYELVTPADTRGIAPYAADAPGNRAFNNWLVTPSGASAGNSLVFFLDGTQPGTDGNGRLDGLRAQRGAAGWASDSFGPSYTDTEGENPFQSGVSPEHDHSFWQFGGGNPVESYLRTPAGFEPIGRGSLGVDPIAQGQLITAGAGHVIFNSTRHLEPGGPPADTRAVYDRSPGGPTHVVSLLPGPGAGVTPAAGQHAAYQGASGDGSAIAFKLAGSLYVRSGGETVKVADAPSFLAGVSDDGGRVFYTTGSFSGTDQAPGGLFAFDVATEATTQIAADAVFVNVAADGSRVYFTSQQQLGDAPLPADLSDKLYLWDGSTIRFVTVLDPEDLVAFGRLAYDLGAWTRAVAAPGVDVGRGFAPSRTTPDGRVLLFQSHGDLTGQNPGGHTQVYRYDSSAEGLICVSCPPGGDAAAADAMFQSDSIAQSPIEATTLIPNVTGDGQVVFFESGDALLPEDVNGRVDVYEWRAQGSGGCARPGGCVALVSSGRGGRDSFLYSMTPDGHDVFFTTFERLVAADEPSSPSIYDARVGGGFPAGQVSPPCVEDACQGGSGVPPALPTAATVTFVGLGNFSPTDPLRASKRVSVTRPRPVRGFAAKLKVKLPSAGLIRLSGASVVGARKRMGKAGTVSIPVRLTARGKRALMRKGRLRLKLRVAFKPATGPASAATVSLTFKRPKQQRHKQTRTRAASTGRGWAR